MSPLEQGSSLSTDSARTLRTDPPVRPLPLPSVPPAPPHRRLLLQLSLPSRSRGFAALPRTCTTPTHRDFVHRPRSSLGRLRRSVARHRPPPAHPRPRIHPPPPPATFGFGALASQPRKPHLCASHACTRADCPAREPLLPRVSPLARSPPSYDRLGLGLDPPDRRTRGRASRTSRGRCGRSFPLRGCLVEAAARRAIGGRATRHARGNEVATLVVGAMSSRRAARRGRRDSPAGHTLSALRDQLADHLPTCDPLAA